MVVATLPVSASSLALAKPFRRLVMFIVLIGLGTWQLERKAWKECLIAALTERTSGGVLCLCRAVTLVRARSQNYGGSAFQTCCDDAPGASLVLRVARHPSRYHGRGYWCSRRLTSVPVVLVNRGFVSEASRSEHAFAACGPLLLTARCAGPSRAAGSCPYARRAISGLPLDHLAIGGRAKGGQRGAFLCGCLTLAVPCRAPTDLRRRCANEHLQYALTWYGLAPCSRSSSRLLSTGVVTG